MNAALSLPEGTHVRFLIDIPIGPPHNITVTKGSEGIIRAATSDVYFIEPAAAPQILVMVAHSAVEAHTALS